MFPCSPQFLLKSQLLVKPCKNSPFISPLWPSWTAVSGQGSWSYFSDWWSNHGFQKKYRNGLVLGWNSLGNSIGNTETPLIFPANLWDYHHSCFQPLKNKPIHWSLPVTGKNPLDLGDSTQHGQVEDSTGGFNPIWGLGCIIVPSRDDENVGK